MTTTRWDRSEDAALREAILGGDELAAASFVERHLDALYEFVHYRMAADRSAAEDVVQDTFVVALDRLSSFDGRSNLHTWLCGIAKNKIRALRRRRRPVPLADVLAESDGEIEQILAQVDSEPLPDWILERRETAELVGATLGSLTPDQRALLLGKYVEGHSVRELASARGKGDKATESSLHRARVAFTKVFQLLARRQGGEP